MNERIYDIDHNKLSEWLTPQKIRKPVFMRFIAALITPVTFLYELFLLYRTAKLYYLKINPQKCYLELMLNNRYDFTQRRIYIDDGSDKPPFYIFQNPELKPKFIRKRTENDPSFIYTSGESGALTDDFIVFVPLDIIFQEPEMISLIKAFKLAGTKFKLQRF